jgi:cell fate (sporulation/competence/biofilm development) regulator YmcA (YheA/YmcA/DUF963 family)
MTRDIKPLNQCPACDEYHKSQELKRLQKGIKEIAAMITTHNLISEFSALALVNLLEHKAYDLDNIMKEYFEGSEIHE